MEKQQEESLQKVKRVWYPLWGVIGAIYGVLLIAYYYQDKFLEREAKKVDLRDRFKTYDLK